MCLASPSSAQEKSCSGITAVRFRLRFSRQTLKVDQVLFCVFSPFAALAQLCWGVMSNAPSYGTCRESKTSRDSKDRVLGSGDVGGTSTAREQFWAISESECQAILNELHPWKLINGTRLEVWPPGVLPKDVPNSPSQWQQKSRGVHMLRVLKSNGAQPVQGKAFLMCFWTPKIWLGTWQFSYYKCFRFRFSHPTSQEVPPAAAAKLSGIPSCPKTQIYLCFLWKTSWNTITALYLFPKSERGWPLYRTILFIELGYSFLYYMICSTGRTFHFVQGYLLSIFIVGRMQISICSVFHIILEDMFQAP